MFDTFCQTSENNKRFDWISFCKIIKTKNSNQCHTRLQRVLRKQYLLDNPTICKNCENTKESFFLYFYILFTYYLI